MQVSAKELSARLERSRELDTLNLSGVDLTPGDFMHLCQGLKLSQSLRQLDLSDTREEHLVFL